VHALTDLSRRTRSLAFAAVLGASATCAAAADELKPFTASYNLSWHGMTVAATTVKLARNGDTWDYTSKGEGRGLGKMFAQSADMESVLKVTPDGVRGESYKATDSGGSDKRTVDLKYDWASHRLTGISEGTKIDMPLTPDVQDDASVQVALMVELLAGRTPDKFTMLSGGKLRAYHYKREGEETVKTPFGDVATVIFSSQADYSPRITRFWCAPDRGFVPMKAEQKKDNDVQWTMTITSFTRN
jgi:Protein of unknown function (DUF3108)